MPSSQQTAFRKATVSTHRLSRHNLGDEHVTTAKFGQIIPIYCAPMVPGSTFHYSPKIYIRTPALQVATFGQIRVKQYSFFVPNRLLWSRWNDFVARGFDESFFPPSMKLEELAALTVTEDFGSDWNLDFANNIYNGFGTFIEQHPNMRRERGTFTALQSNLGLNLFAGVDMSAGHTAQQYFHVEEYSARNIFPFRAYQQIWWDWFRDSVMIPDTAKGQYIHTDSGTQTELFDAQNPIENNFIGSVSEQFQIRYASYAKDYYTTAKTSPQYGQTPLIPISAGFDVNPNIDDTDHASDPNGNYFTYGDTSVGNFGVYNSNGGSWNQDYNTNIGQLSVNTFRYYNALQEYLEQLNVGGTRAIEVLLAQYGVVADAVREDMAEFVGGDDRLLDIVMVTQTAETSEGSLGDNSAYGRVYYDGDMQSYSAKEFGIFMSVMYIEPVTGYCDGIPAMFDWMDRDDWFVPQFENTGYDAIPMSRLYAPVFCNSQSIPLKAHDAAFGFQPRFSDWKFSRDVLAGDFVRPDTSAGADSYHTFRRFYKEPALNSQFTQVRLRSYGNNWNRLFVNTNDEYDPFNVNVTNENNAVLPMEGFASPALSAVYADSGKKVSIPYGGVRL